MVHAKKAPSVSIDTFCISSSKPIVFIPAFIVFISTTWSTFFFNVGVSSCIAYRSPRVEGKTEGVDASNANWRLSSTAAAVIAAVCTFISIIIQLSFVKWSIELSFGRDSFIQHHSLSLSLVYIQKEKEKHQKKEKDGRTVRWCSNRLRNGGFHVKVCRHFFSQEP